MGSGSSTISQEHFWLPEGLNVREPGHRGGLQGCQKCYGGSIHSLQKKIGVAEVRGSSTGTTIIILTPWRTPWWRGFRTCPGERLRFCLWTAPPCNPLDYYFFDSLQMNHQQEPPNHFGLPEGLHGGPIPEHYQGGEYARLVPLPHYTPVCHRGRGWLHLIFFVFILFYILLSWNTRKIKKKTLFLSVWERNSFSAKLPCGPCTMYIHIYLHICNICDIENFL